MTTPNPLDPNQNPAYGQPGAAPDYGQPAGSRYGTQPYAAPGYGAGPGGQYGVVPEPPKFRTLLTLTLVSAALWLLSELPGLFAGSDEAEAREYLRQAGLSAEQIDQIAPMAGGVAVTSTIVSVVIGLALYALVYFNLRGAKNWARILGIVLAILGALGAVGGLFSFIGYAGFAGVLASLLSLGLLIVNILWLVNAFRSDVAAYTRQGRRA